MPGASRRFHAAIVREPGENLVLGLTRVDLGKPDIALALAQHARYCAALEQCGLTVTRLPSDARFPDATFVEDTAVILADATMLCRPGAPSRRGETAAIRNALRACGMPVDAITAPGTLDGGDVCEAGNAFFIGISERTDADAATELSNWLGARGYRCTAIDIRGMPSILHLKSGIAWLGGNTLLMIEELAAHPAFDGFERIVVDRDEAYAANAVRVNDHVLIAGGHPRLDARLQALDYRVIALDMSEFARLDGGLSCLSLRL